MSIFGNTLIKVLMNNYYQVRKLTLRIMIINYVRIYVLSTFLRIIGFFMRHIFQEFKNRIMGEKKHNLSGPTSSWSSVMSASLSYLAFRSCSFVFQHFQLCFNEYIMFM